MVIIYNSGIAHLVHLHHVIAVFPNVINQTVVKRNVHHHHVTVAFQSVTKRNDAKKSANQKNQNVNGQTGRHSAHAVHHATKVKTIFRNFIFRTPIFKIEPGLKT